MNRQKLSLIVAFVEKKCWRRCLEQDITCKSFAFEYGNVCRTTVNSISCRFSAEGA